MPGLPWSPEVLHPWQEEVIRRAGPALAEAGLHLAGGVALALHLGHRRSGDLDWFGAGPLDLPQVRQVFPGSVVDRDEDLPARHIILRLPVGKVELVQVPLNLDAAVTLYPGVLIPGLDELAALKMAAAINRGRKRDIIDVVALLDRGYRAEELLDLVQWRFPGRVERGTALKRLLSFEKRPLFDAHAELDLLRAQPWSTTMQRFYHAFQALVPAP